MRTMARSKPADALVWPVDAAVDPRHPRFTRGDILHCFQLFTLMGIWVMTNHVANQLPRCGGRILEGKSRRRFETFRVVFVKSAV